MSLEIAYAAMGADLEAVRRRLATDERIEKFAKLFLEDASMQSLEAALGRGNLAQAFRHAHTLKGVSRDLGFTPLLEASSALSDALRPGEDGDPKNPSAVPGLMSEVCSAYSLTIDAIGII